MNGIRCRRSVLAGLEHQQPHDLVLIDGEGLGHTPNSAATLSTHVAQRLEEVDAILLSTTPPSPCKLPR